MFPNHLLDINSHNNTLFTVYDVQLQSLLLVCMKQKLLFLHNAVTEILMERTSNKHHSNVQEMSALGKENEGLVRLFLRKRIGIN